MNCYRKLARMAVILPAILNHLTQNGVVGCMTHLGSHTAQSGNSMISRAGQPATEGRLPLDRARLPRAAMNYMDDIKHFPILSEAEEQDLIERWYGRGDRKAYDALIASHLRLV